MSVKYLQIRIVITKKKKARTNSTTTIMVWRTRQEGPLHTKLPGKIPDKTRKKSPMNFLSYQISKKAKHIHILCWDAESMGILFCARHFFFSGPFTPSFFFFFFVSTGTAMISWLVLLWLLSKCVQGKHIIFLSSVSSYFQ